MIRRLLPHLRQYVGVRQALVDARPLGASLTGLLDIRKASVIQLAGRGLIVAVNDVARDLLRSREGLSDQRGVLQAWLPADDPGLQTLVARALAF